MPPLAGRRTNFLSRESTLKFRRNIARRYRYRRGRTNGALRFPELLPIGMLSDRRIDMGTRLKHHRDHGGYERSAVMISTQKKSLSRRHMSMQIFSSDVNLRGLKDFMSLESPQPLNLNCLPPNHADIPSDLAGHAP